MARTVVAIYDDFQTANAAVRELVDNGFPRDNISIIANNTRGEYGSVGTSTTSAADVAPVTNSANQPKTENVADETGAGAGVGAGIGAAIGGIGGLLIGLGALTIPGIGPVIAAGPLAVALTTLTGAGVGAVAGGVTGGLLGALIGLGIPEEEAEFYAEGVQRGGVLVTIQADEAKTEQVMNILNHHNPVDIKERAAQWREQGWKGYNPKAQTFDSAKTQQAAVPITGQVSDPAAVTTPVNRASFDQGTRDFHNHYNTYLANTGYPYDYYAPAYQYGYGVARDARYQNSTWDVIEPNVQRNWELEHPGTWDRFKGAIQHAWEDVSGNPNQPSNR